MLIHKDIEIHELCLYIKKHKTLVIGDLHIGFEESLNRQGIMIPRTQFKEILEKISVTIKKFNPKKVILIGDVKHEFGIITNQEWNQLSKIFKLIQEHAELIVLKGNHDKILEPIASKSNVKVVNEYIIDNIQFLHGDVIPKTLKPIIIIGHEHPAISFQERPTERFKCFLKGHYNHSTLIVMPSFNFISEGSDITKNHSLSPFLKKMNLKNLEVWIIQDKVYYFGELKNLM